MVGIKFEKLVSTSATFLEEFFKDIWVESMPYTDFVIIGGDGFGHQLENAIYIHPERDWLLDIPIGYLPGGSWNGTACDLHAWIENHASTNILWGEVTNKELLVVKDVLQNKEFLTSLMVYGFYANVVRTGEWWRGLLKEKRYNITAAYFLLCWRRF